MPKTLYQSFINTVTHFHKRPLFHINKTDCITYNDQFKSVKNFSNFLNKHNVKKGDNVVVIGNNSHNFASLMLALWEKGAVLIPIYEKQSPSIKNHIINETNPKIIFNSGNKLNYDLEIDHDKLIFTDSNFPLIDSNVDKHDLAAILYTSGTTGNPKGVMLSHSNILSNIKSIDNSSKAMEITENDKYVSFLSWAHCYGLNCEFNYLISKGASTYLNTNLLQLRNDFVEHNPTILCGVPKLFTDIDKKLWFGKYCPKFVRTNLMKKVFGTNLRFSMIGGSSVNSKLLNYYHDSGIDLYQGYGMTEASPLVSSNTIDNNCIGSVGKILNCNEVLIKDGEIYVTGSNVSQSGYYKHPENDSFVMLDNKRYYKSGDSGYINSDGYLFVTGRIKETYKLSNGKFVNPEEIEQIILTIPEISQAMIYAKNGDEFNRLIVVTNLNTNDLTNRINKLPIEKFKIPKNIFITNTPFTLENNLITPKQSLRRNEILKYFNL